MKPNRMGVSGTGESYDKEQACFKAIDSLVGSSEELQALQDSNAGRYMKSLQGEHLGNELVEIPAAFKVGWLVGFSAAAVLISDGELDIEHIVTEMKP